MTVRALSACLVVFCLFAVAATSATGPSATVGAVVTINSSGLTPGVVYTPMLEVFASDDDLTPGFLFPPPKVASSAGTLAVSEPLSTVADYSTNGPPYIIQAWLYANGQPVVCTQNDIFESTVNTPCTLNVP